MSGQIPHLTGPHELEQEINHSSPIEGYDSHSNPTSGHLGSTTLVQERTPNSASHFFPIPSALPHSQQQSPLSSLECSENVTTSEEGSPINTTHSASDELREVITPLAPPTPSVETIVEEKTAPTYEEKLDLALHAWEEKLQERKRILERAHALDQETSAYLEKKPFLHRALTEEEKIKESDFPRFIKATIQEYQTIENEIQSAKKGFQQVVIEGQSAGKTMPPATIHRYQNLNGKYTDLREQWRPIVGKLNSNLKHLYHLLEEGLSDKEDIV